MPKPELGTKRTCLACGARFYDFGKTVELACPACGAVFDLEQVARARRPRNPVRALATAAAKPVDVETEEDDVDETVDDVEEADDADEADDDVDEADAEPQEPDVPVEDDDEEEDPLIEDADELGDDDALGEVIDPDSGEDDDRR